MSSNFFFDNIGRVSSVVEAGQFASSKTLAFVNAPFDETQQSGKLTEIRRWASNVLENVESQPPDLVSKFEFYARNDDHSGYSNSLRKIDHVGVGSHTFQYDNAGQLVKAVPRNASGQIVTNEVIDLGHDSAGQIVSNSTDSSAFEYDANGNLGGEQSHYDRKLYDSRHRYVYDNEGNVIQRTDFGSEQVAPLTSDNLVFFPVLGPPGPDFFSDENGLTGIASWESSEDIAFLQRGEYRLRLTPFEITNAIPKSSVTITINIENSVNIENSDDIQYTSTLEVGDDGTAVFGPSVIDFFVDLPVVPYIEVEIQFSEVTFQHSIEYSTNLSVEQMEGSHDYEWDHRGRLVKMIDRGAWTYDSNGVRNQDRHILGYHTFIYDVFDNLIGRETYSDSELTDLDRREVYVNEDGQRVLSYIQKPGDPEPKLLHHYSYSPSGQLLAVDVAPADDSQSPSLQWVLTDHQGTLRDTYAANGNSTHQSYTPFGTPIEQLADEEKMIRVGFRGMLYDPVLEMYFTNGRWYLPTSGRYVSPDPIGVLGGVTNAYIFAGNTPVSRDGAGDSSQTYRGGSLDNVGYFQLSFYGHLTLDGLGLIPVVGNAFDFANGVWHLAEGDRLKAGLSFVAAVPGLGYAAIGVKSLSATTKVAKVGLKPTIRVTKGLEAWTTAGLSAYGVYNGYQNGDAAQTAISAFGFGISSRYIGKGLNETFTHGIQELTTGGKVQKVIENASKQLRGRPVTCFVDGTPVHVVLDRHDAVLANSRLAGVASSDGTSWSEATGLGIGVSAFGVYVALESVADRREVKRRKRLADSEHAELDAVLEENEAWFDDAEMLWGSIASFVESPKTSFENASDAVTSEIVELLMPRTRLS